MKRIGIDRWLSAYGFMGNPFSSREAGSEKLLNQYFVAPSYFDEILGTAHSPQSAIVFAPRGGGKTAQRVMVDYHCRKQLVDGQILSVLHTEFRPVVEATEGNLSKISVRHHITEILRRMAVAFGNFIMGNPGAIRRFHEMSETDRLYMRWFISAYQNYLTPRHINAFEDAGVKFLFLNNNNAGLSFYGEKIPPDMEHVLTNKTHIPPAELLSNLSDLMYSLGFDAVYILVDCVDEFLLTATNPATAADLVEPLLAELTLMDLPKVAFKFFLPHELEPIIKSRPAIRQDRLIFRRIEWSEQALREVLNKRLAAFSNYSSLDAICVPELRGRIEKEMIDVAEGSPRSLIRMGALILSEHCELLATDYEDEWLISASALESAKNRFRSEKGSQWDAEQPEFTLCDNDILSLIQKGENSKLEFKSTVRWNLKANKPGKEIELAWLKTVVAFMNTGGGILLIGVEDNGNMVGIDADNFQNEDKCLRHLGSLINEHIGLEFSKYINYEIKTVNGEKIVVIQCGKSDDPVFLKNQKDEDFYIRFGPSNRKLSMREMLKYLESKGLPIG